MARKIVLDCDPGHDDAIALLLAHGSPEIDLLAVTTVAGNQTLEKVTRNALAVARSAASPASRSRPAATGRCSGRRDRRRASTASPGSTDRCCPSRSHARPAARRRPDHRDGAAHPPGTVTLVPTGPLTNIALAVRKEPRIVERVAEVVLMGGASPRQPHARWRSSTSPAIPRPRRSCSASRGR